MDFFHICGFSDLFGKDIVPAFIKCLGASCSQIPQDKAVWLLFLHPSLTITTTSIISLTKLLDKFITLNSFGMHFSITWTCWSSVRCWCFFQSTFIQMKSVLGCSHLTCYPCWPYETSNKMRAPLSALKDAFAHSSAPLHKWTHFPAMTSECIPLLLFSCPS